MNDEEVFQEQSGVHELIPEDVIHHVFARLIDLFGHDQSRILLITSLTLSAFVVHLFSLGTEII